VFRQYSVSGGGMASKMSSVAWPARAYIIIRLYKKIRIYPWFVYLPLFGQTYVFMYVQIKSVSTCYSNLYFGSYAISESSRYNISSGVQLVSYFHEENKPRIP